MISELKVATDLEVERSVCYLLVLKLQSGGNPSSMSLCSDRYLHESISKLLKRSPLEDYIGDARSSGPKP